MINYESFRTTLSFAGSCLIGTVHYNMIPALLCAFIGLVLFLHVAERILSLWDDPREPPRVWSRVPFVGHAIGLTRFGPEYFRFVGYEHNSLGSIQLSEKN